jgi:hypothetical protein
LITALITGPLALFAEGLAIGFTFKARDEIEGTSAASTARTVAISGHVAAGILALVAAGSTYFYFRSGKAPEVTKVSRVQLTPTITGGALAISF